MFDVFFVKEKIGSFPTFIEAFNALYKKVKEDIKKEGVFYKSKLVHSLSTFIEYKNIHMSWFHIGDVGIVMGMLREDKRTELCEPKIIPTEDAIEKIFQLAKEKTQNQSIQEEIKKILYS